MESNDNKKLIPKKSKSYHELIFKFSKLKLSSVEYDQGPVGCTLFYFLKEVNVYLDTTNSYGTINCISNNSKIKAICISGGSQLGLEAIAGVNEEILKKKKYKRICNVFGASLNTNNLKENMMYPDKDLGKFAFQKLTKNIFQIGKVGAGCSNNYGQGGGYFKFENGIKILTFVFLNSLGDIYKDQKIFKSNLNKNYQDNKNNTIILIITNNKLNIEYQKNLTTQVKNSLSETIKPFNTIYDNNLLISVSTDELNIELKDNQWFDFIDKVCMITKKAIFSTSQ